MKNPQSTNSRERGQRYERLTLVLALMAACLVVTMIIVAAGLLIPIYQQFTRLQGESGTFSAVQTAIDLTALGRSTHVVATQTAAARLATVATDTSIGTAPANDSRTAQATSEAMNPPNPPAAGSAPTKAP